MAMSKPSDARADCYHAIRHCFAGALAAYLKKNPEYLDDLRSKKEMAAQLDLMHNVLNTLDRYDITRRL